MTPKTVDIETTALSVQELVSLVEEGAEVILTAGDKPLARLSPVDKPSGKRIPNLHPGAWSGDDDISPLPDEIWTEGDERIAGLHEHLGHAWMSDDFNDELPDSFWLEDEHC